MNWTRLSTPITDLRSSYEVVVIGSGYGGAITASRLARAGRDVCLLERGAETVPGDYPDRLDTATEAVQMDIEGRHEGSRSALYQFHVDEEMSVFKGCGLGGTSLVNANVSLEPEPRAFETGWPGSIAADTDGRLAEGFAAARAMLQPQPYPADQPPLDKLEALRVAAGDRKFEKTPINVTFRDGPNAAGVHQYACNGCGDCVTGCNVGAKNTLLMNYLPDAARHGAAIFCEIEVRWVERHGDRWHVHYQPLEGGRAGFDGPPLHLSADIVVLAGGTLGSTEILLRSAARGLPVSDRLGAGFTGNGDVLGFAYNADQSINAIGSGRHRPDPKHPPGPCITGVIDDRGQPRLEDGYIVEEGVIPGALAPMLPEAFALAAEESTATVTDTGLAARARRLWRTVVSIFGGPHAGATEDSMTYLVMGHDDAGGRCSLDDDENLRISWPGVGTSAFYENANTMLEESTARLGADYVPNPTWSEVLGDELVTVHPLGGCGMGDDAGTGVVNDRGQVFAGTQGADVHDSLYVADGAIVPVPLGVNPLLTISALAERNVTLMAEDRGWEIDSSANPPAGPVVEKGKLGLFFTESMKGWFSPGSDGSFEDAEAAGKKADSPMRFVLTITTDDVTTMLSDPAHRAVATGTVEIAQLSAEPMTVTDGSFQLFVENPDAVETQNMRYHLALEAEDGEAYYFDGFKVLEPGSMLRAWPDSTTLFVTIHRGQDATGDVVGRGILHIAPADFARQLTTLKVTGARNEAERLRTVARFGESFAGSMFHDYGGVFAHQTRLARDAPPRPKRPLTCGAPEIHWFESEDGTELRLARYQGGTRGPVVFVPGMGANSGLFSTDTIDTNALEYLYAEGFDVWLFDWRGSPMVPAAHTSFTGDTVAVQDYPAASAKIRELTGADEVDWIVHCVGSITFFMALLKGLEGVRSVVALQVATNPVAPFMTKVKMDLKLPRLLEKMGIHFLDAASYEDESFGGRLFDNALRLYPVPKGERCNSAVCHRITFLYSLCWNHAQLNDLTHEAMHEMFGIADIKMMSHLADCASAEKLVGADGADIYMPHLDRLDLPITFLHGADNKVWVPKSTEVTYDLLRKEFGDANYRRIVFQGYGHLDPVFGKHAARDTYKAFLDHLDRVGA